MAVAQKSHYEVLEISPDASSDEVRQAYKGLCLKWHPDKNPDTPEEATKMMQEIGQAYSVLSDDTKRKNYDRKLNASTDSDEDDSDIMNDVRRHMEEALLDAWLRSMFCPFHAGGGGHRRPTYSFGSGSSRGYTGSGYTRGTANYEREQFGRRFASETDSRPREDSKKFESVESKAANRQRKAEIRRDKKRRQKIGKKFKHPKQEAVYQMISECERDEGVSRDEVWLCLSTKMSKADVDDALNFLKNEGCIHSTRRDHFKATDS